MAIVLPNYPVIDKDTVLDGVMPSYTIRISGGTLTYNTAAISSNVSFSLVVRGTHLTHEAAPYIHSNGAWFYLDPAYYYRVTCWLNRSDGTNTSMGYTFIEGGSYGQSGTHVGSSGSVPGYSTGSAAKMPYERQSSPAVHELKGSGWTRVCSTSNMTATIYLGNNNYADSRLHVQVIGKV